MVNEKRFIVLRKKYYRTFTVEKGWHWRKFGEEIEYVMESNFDNYIKAWTENESEIKYEIEHIED